MANNLSAVGLDIGSTKIRALCVSLNEEERVEKTGFVSLPVSGIRRGIVINPKKVAAIIKEALKELETQIDKKIEEVVVNINGSHLYSVVSHGTVAVSRADKKISQEDVDRVLEAAQTFSLPLNREILETFPREYIIDGEQGIKNPLEMEGVRLEVEILALCGFNPYIRNLEKTLELADVQVKDTVFSPLASAEVVLDEKEKELGVLLIDIGAGTTSFVVFKEQNPISAGVIPIGSSHITNDIAVGLKTDPETAERVKREYGSCFLVGKKKIKMKEKNGEELVFSQHLLGKIIDSRVAEIFEQIQKELKKNNIKKLPGGVVLVGGGAKLPRIKEFAKKQLNFYARIGTPDILRGENDPELSCVVGLAVWGLNQEKDQKINVVVKKIKKFLKIFVP